MEQALRCRTLVKAQNIMGSQSSRKQGREWRKNIQGSARLISTANLEIFMPPSSQEDPPTLMAFPHQFLQGFLESVYQSGGGEILSPMDTVMSIKSQKGQSWRPWVYPAPPSLQILLDPVNLCPYQSHAVAPALEKGVLRSRELDYP